MDIAITATKGDTLRLKKATSTAEEFTLVVKNKDSHACFCLSLSQEHVDMLIPALVELGYKVTDPLESAEHYYKGASDCREAFKEAILNPSCLTCLHGSWFEDASIGIHLHLEDCNYLPPESETYDQDQDEDAYYKAMAALCGHWQIDPRKIGPQW